MMALVSFSRLPNGGNSLQQTIPIWNILSWLASFRMRGPKFIYMVYYIDSLLYVEPSLHLWDKAYLVMVDNVFDVFLETVSQYFIEYLCIYVHEGDCCYISNFISDFINLDALSLSAFWLVWPFSYRNFNAEERYHIGMDISTKDQKLLNIVTDSQYAEKLVLHIETAEFILDESELTSLFIQLQDIIRNRKHPLYITHIRSHTGLPGPLAQAFGEHGSTGLPVGELWRLSCSLALVENIYDVSAQWGGGYGTKRE
ncbi:hypothetical protein STEG23_004866 [Scotinomys teguina]